MSSPISAADASGIGAPGIAAPPAVEPRNDASGDGPRFGQMTFTSVDSRALASGGWQVMHADALSETEIELLSKQVAATFDWPGRIPDIPTAAERDTLPRRLVYAAAGGRAMAYWHTAPAGKDAKNRPGNVFAHVVLDRRPDEDQESLRPVDVAWSVPWLRPFGQPEVRAAELPVLAPRVGAAAEQADELALLQSLTERGGLLAVLLDGLLAAMGGGPPVVLGLTHPESAIYWIGAVGRLMTAGTARTLRWSTLERAATAARSGVHLAIVPREDLSAVPASVVALDELGSPAQGDLGGTPHRAANGAEVAVTRWSGMVTGVLGDLAAARQVVATQDTTAAQVGDRRLPPAWPMALAIADFHRPVPDAQEEAWALAKSDMPDRPPWVLERVPGVLRVLRLGETTANAWDGLRVLAADHDPDTLLRIASRVYLARALADEAWLVRRTAEFPIPPIPGTPYEPDADLRRRAHDQLTATCEQARQAPDPVRFAAVAVRLVDLVYRAGLMDLTQDALGTDTVAQRLLEPALDSILSDPVRAPALVEAVGGVSADVRRELLVPIARGIVAASSQPPGRRLPQHVVTWLHPDPPRPPSMGMLVAEDTVDPLLAEIAAHVTAVVPDPSAFRATALWAELERPQPSPSRIAHLAAGPPLPTADLVALVSRFGARDLSAFLVPALLTTAWDDLGTLVGAIRSPGRDPAGDRYDGPALMAADLRRGCAELWQSREDERRGGRSPGLLDRAQRLLEVYPDLPIASDLWWSLVAAQVVDTIYRPGSERPRAEVDRRIALWGANGGVPQETENVLWNLLRNGAIFDLDVVVAALHGSPQALPGRAAARLHGLAGLTVAGGKPVLDRVVRTCVQQQRFRIGDMQVDAQRRIHGLVQSQVADKQEARSWLAMHDAFAQQWWESIFAAVSHG